MQDVQRNLLLNIVIYHKFCSMKIMEKTQKVHYFEIYSQYLMYYYVYFFFFLKMNFLWKNDAKISFNIKYKSKNKHYFHY